MAAGIAALSVPSGSLAITWLGQASFVLKTPAGAIAYIDPYLSDGVHRLLANERYGFKRIMPAPMAPEDVEADLVICTHAHADHFDVDAVPTFGRNSRIHILAAPDCRAALESLGVAPSKYTIIGEGETFGFSDLQVTGIYADHGTLAPEALGMLLRAGSVTFWQVGDTGYRPDRWRDVFALGVDVLAAPINGAYGNMDEVQAARLAHDAGVRAVIPCHFWMFAEHGGNPARFLDACRAYASNVDARLMAQGETWIFEKK